VSPHSFLDKVEVAKEASENEERETDLAVLARLGEQSRNLTEECHGPRVCPYTLLQLWRQSRDSPLIARLDCLPSYQAALLLTEYHLMTAEGALCPSLRQWVTELSSCGQLTLLGLHREGDHHTQDWGKLAVLQRLHWKMLTRPWEVSLENVQELRSVGLSISEILHSILIFVHCHAVSGLSSSLLTYKSGSCSSVSTTSTSSSLDSSSSNTSRTRRVSGVLRPDKNNESDPEYSKTWGPGDHLPQVREQYSGETSERAWDDFGFSVLSCLGEMSAMVMDNRFSNLPHTSTNQAGPDLKQLLLSAWIYSQGMLGITTGDYSLPNLSPGEKEMVKLACLSPSHLYYDRPSSPSWVMTTVTVQEARIQAELLYCLEAIHQYMRS